MIELILNDYEGNLIISNDQITSSKPFTLSKMEGGRRVLISEGEQNYAYYKSERVLLISVVNSRGSIELTGRFTKPVQVYLFDRSDITVFPATNFSAEEFKINHMKGGLNALVSFEPLSWLKD